MRKRTRISHSQDQELLKTKHISTTKQADKARQAQYAFVPAKAARTSSTASVMRSTRPEAILAQQKLLGNAYTSKMHIARQSTSAIQRCGASCECEDCKHKQEASTLDRDDKVQRSPAPEGMIQREQRTLPPEMKTFWLRMGAQIKLAKRMFSEKRYGCWCGPGNVCEDVQDDIDAACKRHDNDYAAVGVTSADQVPEGQASMWSIEGFRRTMAADARLVAGVQATAQDWHFYGPSAAVYRTLVTIIFGARAIVAAVLVSSPWISLLPPKYLLMDLTNLEALMTRADDIEGEASAA